MANSQRIAGQDLPLLDKNVMMTMYVKMCLKGAIIL
jgi:hypothetical protein